MPLISRGLDSLFNGVSQQPAPLRLPSQHEDLINAYSTVVDGIRKRPGSQHVAELTSDLLGDSNAFIHPINRDVSERYIVSVRNGEVRVFDLDGDEQTVTFPTRTTWQATTAYSKGQLVTSTSWPESSPKIFRCKVAGTSDSSEPTWDQDELGETTDNNITWETITDYLASDDPASDFAMVTIADYSFLVNRNITTRTRTPPDANPHNAQNWAYAFWYADDEFNENNYWVGSGESLTGTVQTFASLPSDEDTSPPEEGDIYKVSGSNTDGFGAYYVKRSGGVWVEYFKPGDAVAFDEETMPHAIVRESDGTFSFTNFPWKVRLIGDAESNPEPSFVGKPLSDVSFYKNRLLFLAGENIVFSAAGDYGQFWLTTATDLLDSAPVDVAVTGKKVSKLLYAVPFSGRLLMFADQTQFALNTNQLLTPTSVSVDAVTEYQVQRDVRPVGVGEVVYFPTPNGEHSRIREYFVREEGENSTSATDITAHVPKYLPKNLLQLAGNSNEDALFAISDTTGEERNVWAYKFFFSGEDRVQSAWQQWQFEDNDDVIAITTIENAVYMLVQRDNGNDSGVFLEKIDLEEGAVTGDLDFEVLLDRLTDVTGVYQGAGPDTTRFTLPYSVPSNVQSKFRIVKGNDFTDAKGQLIDPDTYTWNSDTEIDVPGDQSDGECHCGVNYEMRWELSEQFSVDRQGDARTSGRLQLRTFTVFYVDTAYFKTEVDPYGDDSLTQVEEIVPTQLSAFTGKTIGDDSFKTGEPAFHTGTYRFQVYCNSKKGKIAIVNDSHVQSKFISVEWEGLYSVRSIPQ